MKLQVEDFKQYKGATEAVECVDGVCKLPFGGGEIRLGTPFILVKDGKSWIVSSIMVLNYIMYYVEATDGGASRSSTGREP